MADQNVYKIEPLRGPENYFSWTVKLLDILRDLGIENHVDDASAKCPSVGGSVTQADVDKWKKNDSRALTQIRVRVTENIITYVRQATTAKEAWDNLKKTFGTRGALGIITARRKLFRAECAEGNDIEAHIRTLKTTADELAALDAPLSDFDLCSAILESLPPSFDPLIATIDYSDKKKLDPFNIIARVLEYDRRQRLRNGSEAAFKAQPYKKGKDHNQNKGRDGNTKKGDCNYCKKPGHWARDCRKKKADEANGKPERAHTATSFAWVVQEGEQALIAGSGRDAWIADSGASVHVAWDRNLFVTYTQTPGHTLRGVGSTSRMSHSQIWISGTYRVPDVLASAVTDLGFPTTLLINTVGNPHP